MLRRRPLQRKGARSAARPPASRTRGRAAAAPRERSAHFCTSDTRWLAHFVLQIVEALINAYFVHDYSELIINTELSSTVFPLMIWLAKHLNLVLSSSFCLSFMRRRSSPSLMRGDGAVNAER
ncbi:hypothetical protein QYE76_053767 [Lolium multiflorum]|uniref:Uncharacterized protein n=1 Tax=Lolium multiflorum TaxID=4521 RepID=A0AAD8SWF3_LOLMU|nr:hypothetical protein QYE76_053767 [Lolium multiflorum]